MGASSSTTKMRLAIITPAFVTIGHWDLRRHYASVL
jgi:hypothetical protein